MLTDIDECKTSNNTCISDEHCRNEDGFYECFCPHGQSGNGTLEGGCHRRDVITKVAIGKFLNISEIYFIRHVCRSQDYHINNIRLMITNVSYF